MERKVIIDNGDMVINYFDKEYHNDRYDIFFNTKTGFEVLTKDPFYTDLPTMLDIGIMGHCINNCSFCYQGNENQPHMLLEDYKSIIDQVKHHASQVALGGRGNPEDHPHFEEIVKYTRESGMVPNYTTAGNNVDDKIVGLTKEYCGAVAVSMYREHFTFKALKAFIDGGAKTNIHWIYNKYSHFNIIRLLKGDVIWNDLDKLNAIILLLFKPIGNAKNMEHKIPTINQIKELSKEITSFNGSFKIGMDSCMVNKTKRWMKLNRQQEMSVDSCESGRMSVYISPDMKMVPCSFLNSNIHGVSLYDKTISDVWNHSPSFKKIRKILGKNPYTCPAMINE